jgi:PPM family protein phosphatase
MERRSKGRIATKRLRYDIGTLSDIGLVRSYNEDSLISMNLQRKPSDGMISLCAVADGLGGYQGGDIASKMALQVLSDNISKFILSATCQKTLHRQESVLHALTEGVKAANKTIFSSGQTEGNNMATTLVAALLINDTVYIANVGDSRAYCLDGELIHQISADHSLVADFIKFGELSPEEIYTHPQRNIVTRCLGSTPDIEADLFIERLKPGQSVLLCSDGLWEMVRDDEIKKIIGAYSTSQAACEQLAVVAKQNGGIDNISVIIIKISG